MPHANSKTDRTCYDRHVSKAAKALARAAFAAEPVVPEFLYFDENEIDEIRESHARYIVSH